MVRDETKEWLDRFTELVANDKDLHDATVNLLNAIADHEEAKAMKIKVKIIDAKERREAKVVQ